MKEIKYLNQAHPNLEWSGVLFFKIKGSIVNASSLEIFCEHLVPMDSGTAGYTEFTYDPNYFEYIMKNNLDEGWRQGKIHSHHNMAVFHSGTDNDDLQEHCRTHPWYLSIIVNNRFEWDTKISVFCKEVIEETPVTKKIMLSYNNDSSELISKKPIKERLPAKTTEREYALVYNCHIICEEEALPSQDFIDRFNYIKSNKNVPVNKYYQQPVAIKGFQRQFTNTTFNILNGPEAANIIIKALDFKSTYSLQDCCQKLKSYTDKELDKACDLIEKELYKRFFNDTNLKYNYNDYLTAFADRLDAMTYMDDRILDLAVYFRTLADAEIRNNEKWTEEDTCKVLSMSECKNSKELKDFFKEIGSDGQKQKKYAKAVISTNPQLSLPELSLIFREWYMGQKDLFNLQWVEKTLIDVSNEEEEDEKFLEHLHNYYGD